MNAKRSTTCSVAVAALLMIAQGCSDEVSSPSAPGPQFAPGTSLGVNLDQCANSPRTSPCTWLNGNLNQNNSTYAEGLVVPFRLAIEGLSPGQHTIQINYDFTAGGHKAYDFLASVDATELVNICAPGGGGRSSLCGTDNGGMPASVQLATSDFGADAFQVDGLDVSAAQAAFTNDLTRRQLRAYGASAVSISAVTHAGSTDGNSTGNIMVTFTSIGSAVALVWGGHLADSDFWNGNNPPDGAGEVSGAPWHMRTQQLDNSGNKNQDRSIQPSAIIEPPNLTITKTADAATVSAGDPIGFTITVTNTGAGAATNVDIDDTLPAGLTWTESPDKTECTITGGNILHCDIASLASGASFNVHVGATTSTADCPGVTNTATTNADNNDLVTSNEASITIECPVLDIEKTTSTPTVDAGQTASFTITVTNNGPGTATNVDIDDTLPTGHTWTENPNTAECSISGAGSNILHCDIASLAQSASFAVTVQTTATATDCDGITNLLATADADNAGQVSDGPVTVNVNCPVLDIEKSTSTPTVDAGQTASFTIEVTNNGPGTAVNVDIDDTLPASHTWTENPATTECAITGGNVLHCDIASLAAGASFSVTVETTATTADCDGITNPLATADADNAGQVSDGPVTVNVNCPVLDIEKSTSTPTVDAGQTASFTIEVTNNGPGTAVNVDIDDTLPASHTWTENPATTECAITGGNVLHCDIASLAAGASFSVTVETTATTADCDGITNPLATADADNAGQVSDGPVTVNVNCPVLSVEKTTSNSTVDAGQKADFTITVTNDGPGTAVNVDLDDTLPAGLSWTENPDKTECDITGGNVLHCDVGDLADGASFSVTVEATTDTDDCPSIQNQKATADADNAEQAESGQVTVNVNCPVLSVAKSAASGTVSGGEDVGYTVTVTNDGPGTAVNVDLDDTLPAGLTWTEDPDKTECDITGGNVLHCDVGDLADGASFSVSVKAPTTGDDCGTIENTATADADNAGLATSLEVSIDIECPNLAIVKTPNAGTAVVGDMATFTIEVTNSGLGKAFDTAIVDTLPVDLTWSEDPDLTDCSIASVMINSVSRQILTCAIGTLDAGASFTVSVKSNTIPSSFLLPSGGGTPVVPLEIDGNLVDGAATGIDWENSGIDCATLDGCDIDQPTGSTDNSFGMGTKEDTEVPSIVSGQIPNNKSDLLRFYVTSRKQQVGADVHDFLYLAWERVQAPNGTTNMDFELNQSSDLSANGVTPVRTAGDILVKYDLAKGGGSLSLGYHVWTTAASAGGQTAAQVCEASNSFPCWAKVQALNPPAVAGAANAGSVVDNIAPDNPRTLDPLTFGEAGIDLQAAGIFQTGVCRNFGKAYLKSRSSDSFNSEIKDFIAPIDIDVTNCQPRTIDNTAWANASNFAPAGGQLGDFISDDGHITVTENGSAFLIGAPTNVRLAGIEATNQITGLVTSPAETSTDLRVQSAASAERAESPWSLQRLHELRMPDGLGPLGSPDPGVMRMT